MSALISTPVTTHATWPAELELGFTRPAARTLLSHRRHIGPLLVQRPFYPEGDVCHVYVVHPPGGIAGGDQLRLDATLHPNSHALITTPAATKFYRTLPERSALLRQELKLEAATLEWLPQETIIFRDARASMTTRIHLDEQSKFIGWELTCYGRPASKELFDAGHVRQNFELWLNERPLMLDHLQIDASQPTLQAPWGLANHTMLGTLLAYPATIADLEIARQLDIFSCSLVDSVLLCRLLSNDSGDAKKAFVNLWKLLRPRLLKRDAVTPRIWAT